MIHTKSLIWLVGVAYMCNRNWWTPWTLKQSMFVPSVFIAMLYNGKVSASTIEFILRLDPIRRQTPNKSMLWNKHYLQFIISLQSVTSRYTIRGSSILHFLRIGAASTWCAQCNKDVYYKTCSRQFSLVLYCEPNNTDIGNGVNTVRRVLYLVFFLINSIVYLIEGPICQGHSGSGI